MVFVEALLTVLRQLPQALQRVHTFVERSSKMRIATPLELSVLLERDDNLRFNADSSCKDRDEETVGKCDESMRGKRYCQVRGGRL